MKADDMRRSLRNWSEPVESDAWKKPIQFPSDKYYIEVEALAWGASRLMVTDGQSVNYQWMFENMPTEVVMLEALLAITFDRAPQGWIRATLGWLRFRRCQTDGGVYLDTQESQI